MEDLVLNIVNFVVGLLHVSPQMLAMIFGVLFLISEGLAYIPAINSNSVFQAIMAALKKLAGK